MIRDYFFILSAKPELRSSEDYTARYCQLMAENNAIKANEVRADWKKANLSRNIENKFNALMNTMDCPEIDLNLLPEFSFLLSFKFTLEKPYLSRDEKDFYIIDNPVRKDKVFGLPFVAPSSWKGSLRAALARLDDNYNSENLEIQRIFGNNRHEERQEMLRAGRLHFFPTFFSKIDLEIINPHDRDRKVGINPILMESVPEGTSGIFSLLYVPYDLIGKDENEIKNQVIRHIILLMKGIAAMFKDYGFGAKTSSGYGIARSDLADGKIVLRAKNVKAAKDKKLRLESPDNSFEKYLTEDGRPKEEFMGSGEAGLLSTSEYSRKGEELGGGSQAEFKKFRRWYGAFGEGWQEHIASGNAPSQEWPEWTFNSFDQLLELTRDGSFHPSTEGLP
jgi:CRISPR-associated protein Cmr2